MNGSFPFFFLVDSFGDAEALGEALGEVLTDPFYPFCFFGLDFGEAFEPYFGEVLAEPLTSFF